MADPPDATARDVRDRPAPFLIERRRVRSLFRSPSDVGSRSPWSPPARSGIPRTRTLLGLRGVVVEPDDGGAGRVVGSRALRGVQGPPHRAVGEIAVQLGSRPGAYTVTVFDVSGSPHETQQIHRHGRGLAQLPGRVRAPVAVRRLHRDRPQRDPLVRPGGPALVGRRNCPAGPREGAGAGRPEFSHLLRRAVRSLEQWLAPTEPRCAATLPQSSSRRDRSVAGGGHGIVHG